MWTLTGIPPPTPPPAGFPRPFESRSALTRLRRRPPTQPSNHAVCWRWWAALACSKSQPATQAPLASPARRAARPFQSIHSSRGPPRRRCEARTRPRGLCLAARDGGHDTQLVTGVQAGLQPFLEPNVFAIQVQVHEASQCPRLVAQATANRGVAGFQLREHAGDRRSLQAELGLAVSGRAQGRRNAHANTHVVSTPTGSTRTPCSFAHDSDFSTASGVPTTSRMTQPRSWLRFARRIFVTTPNS